ncbi:MAG: PAS domain S-box protein [Dehalococcoidia bacterium]|nr:PAS domain S-box protein [Dehalococcoidia bacterium]
MTTGWDAHTLLEQAPDAIIFADREGLVRYWNPAAERVFGHKAADVLGGGLYVIIPEQFREAHDRGFERALTERKTKYVGQALATRARHANGEDFYVELSFSIVLDADGNAVGALAHARDITERFTRDRDARRHLRAVEQELAALRADAVTEAAPGPA